MSDRSTKRILIVEDEVLVAMHLEDLLTEMGHLVVGPATRVAQGMELARLAEIDFAVLDVNVAGTRSFPIADILRGREIPFVFATGYGVSGLDDGYRDQPTLSKPYHSHELARVIARAFADRP